MPINPTIDDPYGSPEKLLRFCKEQATGDVLPVLAGLLRASATVEGFDAYLIPEWERMLAVDQSFVDNPKRPLWVRVQAEIRATSMRGRITELRRWLDRVEPSDG